MNHYVICLTIDIDPEGLSGVVTNRNTSGYKCFEAMHDFPAMLQDQVKQEIPLTWFIRIDEQINYFFGNLFHLTDKYNQFFEKIKASDHELAWHPHIYEKLNNDFIISEKIAYSCDQIASVHSQIQERHLDFSTFRNGEGWHTNETMKLIKKLGFTADSTSIPGISKPPPHLLDWSQSPNHPYFPSCVNYQIAGNVETILEIPMNTWFVKATYDPFPRLRYLNPSVHGSLFSNAFKMNNLFESGNELNILTLISHPDEIVEQVSHDMLYGRSIRNYISNIQKLIIEILQHNCTYEFLTLNQANKRWRTTFHHGK